MIDTLLCTEGAIGQTSLNNALCKSRTLQSFVGIDITLLLTCMQFIHETVIQTQAKRRFHCHSFRGGSVSIYVVRGHQKRKRYCRGSHRNVFYILLISIGPVFRAFWLKNFFHCVKSGTKKNLIEQCQRCTGVGSTAVYLHNSQQKFSVPEHCKTPFLQRCPERL